MKRILIGIVVLAIGLGLLYGTYASVQNTLDFRKAAAVTDGVVYDFATHRSDGKTMYTPQIRFTTEDGRDVAFSGGVSSSSPSYDRGETVKVLYRRETPEDARLDGFMDNWFAALMLSIFGTIFTLIGAGVVKWGVTHVRVRKWLAQHGMKVRAKLIGPELNTTYKVNGSHPWRLRAQWQHPVTQKIHVFYSDNVWYDPTDYCTTDTIEALVNADDPRQYQLDTSFLPQQA